MTGVRFRTTVELGGKTATGLVVPDDVVAALDAGSRPAVVVTVNGHGYRTTVASRGGRFLVPLSAANRLAAGVEAGQEVEVDVALDTAPREVEVPDDLARALADAPEAGRFFDGLSHTHRKEWARWVGEAKTAGTRERRLAATVEALTAGRRTR